MLYLILNPGQLSGSLIFATLCQGCSYKIRHIQKNIPGQGLSTQTGYSLINSIAWPVIFHYILRRI
ncbi:MAG: hypothetical protein JXB24_10550 [Bacteroidales bacterium]|nr:hypothetical protein [Bacteroidales bacterium]